MKLTTLPRTGSFAKTVLFIATLFVTGGCEWQERARIAARKRAEAEVAAKDQARNKFVAEVQVDPSVITAVAVARLRTVATDQWHYKEADQARITPADPAVRPVAAEEWEVTGRYEGKDKDGKALAERFAVRVRAKDGALQAYRCSMLDPDPTK